jgi:hypothetical protein
MLNTIIKLLLITFLVQLITLYGLDMLEMYEYHKIDYDDTSLINELNMKENY